MKRISLYIIILLAVSFTNTHAQLATTNAVIVANQYVAKANEAFSKNDYATALEHYLTVLNDLPKRTNLYWNTAESAFNTRKFNIASKYFEQLSKTDSAKNYPMLNLRRAAIKKMYGDYEGTIALLQPYVNNNAVAGIKSADFASDIQKEIESCEWAKEALTKPQNNFEIKPVTEVNTNLTDIAPVYYNTKLYYTTAYLAEGRKPTTHVFSTDLSNKSMPLALNEASDSFHTAGYARNTEGTRVYYNVCTQNENGSFHCSIYFREILADDRTPVAVKLAEAINLPNYTAAQPTVGFDSVSQKDILYFVSDRPGGKGKLDIWYAELDKQGNASTPMNLSAVNSAKDDITPFFFNGGNMLFFSSEGYKSLGGFDVFYAKNLGNGSWSSVTHGEMPINSSFDDTYFTINGDLGKAYLSSNRKGKTCNADEKDCICNDIYGYDVKADLKAETFIALATDALKGCRLELIDLETGQVLHFNVNENGNDFSFPLELNKRYRLIGSKLDHISDTVEFTTRGMWKPTSLYEKLELMPKAKPQVTIYVFDAMDLKPLDGARIDVREIGSNKLVATEILKGNVFNWSGAEFGKSYQFLGYKNPYDSDSTIVNIELYEYGRKDYDYKDSLFLLPFRGLPLTLYFDNDHPNPDNQSTATDLTYDETYTKYIGREKEYLAAYYRRGKGGKNQDMDALSAAEANKVTSFFNKEVRGNYSRLVEFSGLLHKYMLKKQKIEIVIEGYASPLAETEYNRKLTSRRIMSLINHFYQYGGGILQPFLLDSQLQIRVLPFGEDKAEKTVSDDARDPRKSIYSVEAMKERKVEIKEINRLDDPLRSMSSIFSQFVNPRDHISFLNNRLEVESKFIGKRTSPTSYSNLGGKLAIKGIENTTKSTVTTETPANYGANTKKASDKQKFELVLIDGFTGKVIEKNGSIEIIDLSNEKLVGKAKRKGEIYRYDLPSDKTLSIKTNVGGYNAMSRTFYGINTEGGLGTLKDTLFLTPFNGLPLPLYFDNDRPDPNTKKGKTAAPYDKAYKQYYGQKSEFVKKYNKILTNAGGVPALQNEMEAFFNTEVKEGYEKVEGYVQIMKTYLKEGYSIEVVIEGYASPLANASYNEYLTQRRINSVVNFFSSYQGGNLKQYITNGQLKIQVKPLGESQASSSISDDSQDPLNSVYGLGASRERKVVIKDILINRR